MKKRLKETSHQIGKLKIVGLTALILGLCLYGWTIYKKYQGLPPKEPDRTVVATAVAGPSPPPPFRRPSPRELHQSMGEVMDELRLTDEQRARIEELFAKGRPQTTQERRERFAAFREITTPAQQIKFMGIMQHRISQRLKHAHQALDPKDFETLQKRLQSRLQQHLQEWRAGSHPEPRAQVR